MRATKRAGAKKGKQRTGLVALAKRLEISKELLFFHQKNPQAPKSNDFEGWKVFLAAHGREESGPTDLRRRLAEKRLSILTTEDRRRKTELKELERELIPKDEAQRCVTRFVAGLVHRLLPVSIRVSHRFALESDPQTIEAQLTKEIRDAIQGADQFKYGAFDCPKCKQPIQI